MHPLHDYVAKQLADKLKSRRVVVWYDERGEFQPFVDEVRGGARGVCETVPVAVAGAKASLAQYTGSMFELRTVVEPVVSGDTPDTLVVYVPGLAHDAKASVLMELETAGKTWKPELRHLCRNVLLQKFTVGVADEMLSSQRKLTYEDMARALTDGAGAEPPSVLRTIFHEAKGSDALIAAWLAADVRDAEIIDKGAPAELTKLVKSRLGLELPAESSLAKLRAITLRYVLAGEFRLDLSCDPPPSLGNIARPSTKSEESAVREIARSLRASYGETYAGLADRIETELGVSALKLPPGALGAIDTFRFEERALLTYAGDLIADGRFQESLTLVSARENSFWLDRDLARKAQWEATRRMAELGSVAAEVRGAVGKASGDAATWLEAYAAKDGWHRLDRAQRGLEAWVATLDEGPEERPLGVVRRAYDDACRAMANGFTNALTKAGWVVKGALHQTRVFSEVVSERPKPVAYFLVDAMRFEMGVELAERLPKGSEVTVRPALAALPSITPIGMAALLPGASASFSAVDQGGRFGAQIEGSFLPDVTARKKHAAARIPKLVDLTLGDLLSLSVSRLKKKVEGAPVVIVRSQEIDLVGEGGLHEARQVMDTVIENLRRAIGRLASAGIEHAVLSADHGHLFLHGDRDDSMKVGPPGGETVDLHRRCWIGRGGSTPPGCIRVSAAALGYASDLDLVFPPACGVFRAGGDLAFHHGGPSLQEMVVPVLTVRTRAAQEAKAAPSPVQALNLPEAVTNRIFSVVLTFGEGQLKLDQTGLKVRPVLVSSGREVGAVGMAIDAELDRATGSVLLSQGRPVTIAFVLNDDSVPSLRVVVQDPSTDADLFRSQEIPVRLGL